MYIVQTRSNLKSSQSQRGATLIEVLVSVVIIAIGLLGLAALQNTSMRLSYDSYIRTQANFLAYDLIDRVRANPNAPVYTLSPNAALGAQDCYVATGPGCSPNDIRAFDLFTWRERARDLLPDATVEITFNDLDQIYSMRISWEDRFDNDIPVGAADGVSDEAKEFVYHFKI